MTKFHRYLSGRPSQRAQPPRPEWPERSTYPWGLSPPRTTPSASAARSWQAPARGLHRSPHLACGQRNVFVTAGNGSTACAIATTAPPANRVPAARCRHRLRPRPNPMRAACSSRSFPLAVKGACLIAGNEPSGRLGEKLATMSWPPPASTTSRAARVSPPSPAAAATASKTDGQAAPPPSRRMANDPRQTTSQLGNFPFRHVPKPIGADGIRVSFVIACSTDV